MLKIETKISDVSIFRNGAEVIRKGSVELEEGKQTLQLLGLSSSALNDTVRIFSKEGISCSNIRFNDNDDEDDKESDRIKEQIEIENKKIESINLQISLWQNNGDFSSHNAIDVNEVESYIEKLPGRIEKLYEQIFEINKKIRQLQKKLEEVSRKEDNPNAIVDVYCEKAGAYPIELRYHDSNPSWSPTYEVTTDGKSSLELLMKARINQNTNEDWKDVNVSLFTGNPSSNYTLPVIRPTYLNIRTNQNLFKAAGRASANMMMGMAAASAESMVMMDEEAAPMRMAMNTATVKNDETMSEYILPDKKDIFRNEDTMADLEHYDLKAEFKIVAVAKKDPHAYLVATIKSGELPIKEAVNAGIYLKGVYTGDVYLDPDMTDEDFDISLGREERIFVRYKLASKKNSNVLLKGQKCSEYVYETTVTNKTGNKVEVLLKDQLPVSQDKTITVEKIDLGGFKLDEETGLMNKTVAIEDNESVTVRVSYKVSWPKDKDIQESASRTKICPSCGASATGKFCPVCGSPVE